MPVTLHQSLLRNARVSTLRAKPRPADGKEGQPPCPHGYNQTMPFDRAILGRTGIEVCRIGLASSYGAPASAVALAFDRGVNYFYWGSIRRGGFGDGLRALAPRRDRFLLVTQSYSRMASLVGPSLERALKALRFDYTDVLLLGLWNGMPPPRILEACRKLRERGLVRYVAISTHNRPLIGRLAGDPQFDIFHVRYNAVHRGAEREVFSQFEAKNPPGLVSFTATSLVGGSYWDTNAFRAARGSPPQPIVTGLCWRSRR